jgi:hypothetical protein
VVAVGLADPVPDRDAVFVPVMLAPIDNVAVVVFVGLNVGLAVVDGEGVMEPEIVVVIVAEVEIVPVRLGVPVLVPVLDGLLVPVPDPVTVAV